MTKFPVLPLAPSRNILIALSSGQGIQPWLMGLTEVAYGSFTSILAFRSMSAYGAISEMPGCPVSAIGGRRFGRDLARGSGGCPCPGRSIAPWEKRPNTSMVIRFGERQ